MSDIAELVKISQRIAHLVDREQYGAVGKAQAIPYAWKGRVEAISITARDGHWAREARPEDIEAAKAIRAELAAKYALEGEAERTSFLAAICSELESLRAVLPSIAAKAAIEAGVHARDIARLPSPSSTTGEAV